MRTRLTRLAEWEQGMNDKRKNCNIKFKNSTPKLCCYKKKYKHIKTLDKTHLKMKQWHRPMRQHAAGHDVTASVILCQSLFNVYICKRIQNVLVPSQRRWPMLILLQCCDSYVQGATILFQSPLRDWERPRTAVRGLLFPHSPVGIRKNNSRNRRRHSSWVPQARITAIPTFFAEDFGEDLWFCQQIKWCAQQCMRDVQVNMASCRWSHGCMNDTSALDHEMCNRARTFEQTGTRWDSYINAMFEVPIPFRELLSNSFVAGVQERWCYYQRSKSVVPPLKNVCWRAYRAAGRAGKCWTIFHTARTCHRRVSVTREGHSNSPWETSVCTSMGCLLRFPWGHFVTASMSSTGFSLN
jgi:hypothetical protein